MISDDEIKKIARLANLQIPQEEVGDYAREMNAILQYFQSLERYDVSSVQPMSHVHGIQNVFRADEVQEAMPIEEALLNAPDVSGRYIRVPIIIDQG